nr:MULTISPECIES: GxxExxY protein [Elizabethkingia]
MVTKKYLDDLTYEIIGSCIEIHKVMGRGLLESVYHQCLKEELLHRKINFQSEMKIPVMYKNKILDIDFRCDFLLNNALLLN